MLFFEFEFGLLLVGLDLLFELFSLRVNLRRQSVLDAILLVILILYLLVHQLHLLKAFFLKLLELDVQILRLFPNQLVFFFRAGYVVRHLRLDCFEVFVEVFNNLLPLRDFVIRNLSVPFLELPVLPLVLPRDLLIFLSNDLSLGSSVLVIKCLLVVELFVNLGLNGSNVDLTNQGNHLLSKQYVQTVGPLLARHPLGHPCPLLVLSYLDNERSKY